MKEERIQRWVVHQEEEQDRVDKVLTTWNPDWTRTQIQSWIDSGRVAIDGEPVTKAAQKLSLGMEVTVEEPVAVAYHLQPEEIPLDVRYEDQDVIVINKAAGMVVHPSPGHDTGTLVHALLAHCGATLLGVGGELRPGIVHRLDKDTSGLLVVAKHDISHRALTEQLKEHKVKRIYWALVRGVVKQEQGTIQAPLGRDPFDRKRFCVLSRGKPSTTHFTVEQRLTDATLLRCQLETGRTHQIRVHLRHVGFPLLGDPVYGPRKPSPHLGLPGQALHAGKLGFTHPRTGKWLETEADRPAYFDAAIQMLEPASVVG